MGIPFYDLKAGKFYKTFDPIRLARIPFGFFQALYLLLKIRPELILSFGGYLAVPTVLAGYVLGIPSFTHEQTLVVGYANKLISTFAKKIFISWPTSLKYFDANKTIYSGLPLRTEIKDGTSNNFNLNASLPTIYITAGKTGSHNINTLIIEALPQLLNFCNVIHQCGDNSVFNDYTALSEKYENIKSTVKGVFILRKFVQNDEIGEAFVKSSLVISRAGAHIISELLSLEKPSILIPINWVSHNEQNINADFLVHSGLAIKLDEKAVNANLLLTVTKDMLQNLSLYKLQDPEYKKYINKNAPHIISSEVLKELAN
jgi:UDP-N-acetylglucosamine--N-acetylmuramyl-(pentapeptide) pyrophosphoryl-undecaprenol N-acetylglucosamine transferase